MRRLVWAAAWAAVALWSLIAWGAYGLVDVFGGLLAGGAGSIGVDPSAGAFVAWIISALKGLGLFAIVAVWLLVSAAILSVGFVLSKLFGSGARIDVTHYQGGFRVQNQRYDVDDRRHGPVVDVTPNPPPADKSAQARDLVRRFEDRR